MWLRWAILIGLALLVWRLLLPRRDRQERAGIQRREAGGEEVLVRDPFCQTYLPKSQAVELELGDERLFFCSRKCRDAYLKKRTQK